MHRVGSLSPHRSTRIGRVGASKPKHSPEGSFDLDDRPTASLDAVASLRETVGVDDVVPVGVNNDGEAGDFVAGIATLPQWGTEYPSGI